MKVYMYDLMYFEGDWGLGRLVHQKRWELKFVMFDCSFNYHFNNTHLKLLIKYTRLQMILTKCL